MRASGFLVVVLVAAAGASAAAAHQGTGLLSTDNAAPVRFALGPDGSPGPFVAFVALREEAAAFDASLRAVPEATTRFDALVLLQNTGLAPATATLSGTRMDDAGVDAAWLLVDGARIDLLATDPSATVALAPGAAVPLGFETTLGTTPPGAQLPTWGVRLDVSTS